MKTVIIHGQNHKGTTYHIGRMLADKLSTENEITEFFLPKDLNCFCLGCFSCLEDESKCPYYDKKSVIIKAMEEAEVLIFTTPTYCMRASAPMKAFIDLTYTNWMMHRPKAYMFEKKAVVISTSAGSNAKTATKDVAVSLQNWGIPYIRTYGIAAHAMAWSWVNEKNRAKIEKKMSSMAAKIKKIGVPPITLKTRILFAFFRGMQKAGWGASPFETKYWEDMGWLGNKRPWTKK